MILKNKNITGNKNYMSIVVAVISEQQLAA